MEEIKSRILVVDDEPFNLDILIEFLEDAGYETTSAENGLVAWNLLESSPERFDALLLDRMMPEMDGLEVLTRIKAHPILKTLPVIMQTAKAGKEDILEGLRAGAYYYLTKPFEKENLLAIVKTAVNDHQEYINLQYEVQQTTQALSMMSSGRFEFQTLEEAKSLAALLAHVTPNPKKVVLGLSELLINAVEHGNLGISYEKKSTFTEPGDWLTEVQHRLTLPENREKQATVYFERKNTEVSFFIQDEGNGFAWKNYMDISPERAFHTHGRGIAIANSISFDHLEYKGNGNQVLAVVNMDSVHKGE